MTKRTYQIVFVLVIIGMSVYPTLFGDWTPDMWSSVKDVNRHLNLHELMIDSDVVVVAEFIGPFNSFIVKEILLPFGGLEEHGDRFFAPIPAGSIQSPNYKLDEINPKQPQDDIFGLQEVFATQPTEKIEYVGFLNTPNIPNEYITSHSQNIFVDTGLQYVLFLKKGTDPSGRTYPMFENILLPKTSVSYISVRGWRGVIPCLNLTEKDNSENPIINRYATIRDQLYFAYKTYNGEELCRVIRSLIDVLKLETVEDIHGKLTESSAFSNEYYQRFMASLFLHNIPIILREKLAVAKNKPKLVVQDVREVREVPTLDDSDMDLLDKYTGITAIRSGMTFREIFTIVEKDTEGALKFVFDEKDEIFNRNAGMNFSGELGKWPIGALLYSMGRQSFMSFKIENGAIKVIAH
jgi:hypothetical protein